jgi:DNA polymerase I-like protein with 3'-5' exonuclease and polymerase domains
LEQYPRLSGVVSLDLETKDTKLKERGPGWCFKDNNDFIAGFAFAGEWGQRYWPIRHRGGGNLPVHGTIQWVKDQLANPDLTVICHNGMYDRGWLAAEGIKTRCKFVDTMTAGPLINEYRNSYSLDKMMQDYIGEQKVDIAAKLKEEGLTKNDIWILPGQEVDPYASQDAGGTFRLWPVLKALLDKDDLNRVFQLEMDLHPLLIEMRMRGIRVDFDRAEQARIELMQKEQIAQMELDRLCGYHVDVWGKNIAPAFDAAGIEYPLTPKTKKPSITGPWLDKQTNELCKLIKEVRRYNKARGTFIDGYVLDKAVNGRIHCQFNPLPKGDGGAVSGRFSSSDPNLQNLPNPERDEYIGLLVRELYLPEEGEEWISADYSQQEPRLAVHYAAILDERNGTSYADSAVRAFRENPGTDFHQFVADITGLTRKRAKIMNLALMYGRGGASTAHELGLPTEWVWSNRWQKNVEIAGPEAQSIIDQYHERMPFVKSLSEECKRRAGRNGYIKTLSGRRCHFHRKYDAPGTTDNWAYAYVAMNRLIQGGSADQMKMAMLEVYKENIVPLASIHDELAGSGDKPRAKKIETIMRDVVPLKIPSKVDIAMGPSWGRAA